MKDSEEEEEEDGEEIGGGGAATTEEEEEVGSSSSTASPNPLSKSGIGNSHLFVYSAPKAGMGKGAGMKRDPQEVSRVIYEMSKGSAYFQNQVKLDKQTDARIRKMKAKLRQSARLHQAMMTTTTTTTAAKKKKKGNGRENTVFSSSSSSSIYPAPLSTSRVFAVVDLDAFFASVEERDDPTLRDVPFAVGGIGMLSTSNYIARKWGVRSAMPGFIALKLCPQLRIVRSRMKEYVAVGERIRGVFREFDPHFRSGSIDEAKLDLTDYIEQHWHIYQGGNKRRRRRGEGKEKEKEKEEEEDHETAERETNNRSGLPQSPREHVAWQVVSEIRRRIFAREKITCSAGIGISTMVAKIASDMNKPNGQYLVGFSQVYF